MEELYFDVIEITENEDGSAMLSIDASEEGINILLKHALKDDISSVVYDNLTEKQIKALCEIAVSDILIKHVENWRVRVPRKSKTVTLGHFESKEEAIIKRDEYYEKNNIK